jgi:ribosomal subunit interface protein
MTVWIKGLNFEVDPALREHTTRRLRLAVARFGEEIEQVTAVFSEEAGERHCRIEVRLKPPRLRSDEADRDPFAAADRAIDRTARALARALER